MKRLLQNWWLDSIFAWSLLLLLFVGAYNGLTITEMTAPKLVDPRDNQMQLQCHYNMGSEELYAVKWYKDDNEFFRYTPSQPPYVLKFPVSGVKVLSKESVCARGRCDLVLTDLNIKNTSGEYRCEVSSEAPAFRIASKTMNISVAALPDQKPKIESLIETYKVGDYLTARCISAPANPTPHLKFYVNDRQIPEKYTKEIIVKQETDGKLQLVSREIGVHLRIDQLYFNSSTNGKMRIGCTSSMPQLSADVSPILTSTKIVTILDRKIINNEKYQWPLSVASSSFSFGNCGRYMCLFSIFISVNLLN